LVAALVGKDKTSIRGGYGVSYFGTSGRGSAIDSSIGQGPGTLDQITYTSSGYLDLSKIFLPLPKDKPGFTIPITQRTQSIDGWDPNFVNPYIQSFNFSVTRELKRNVTMDVRYVGTKGTKLYGTIPLNQPNFLTNGLKEALDITRSGGNAPLFDQMLKGINLNPTVAGFGAIGTVVNGVLQTGRSAPEYDFPWKHRQRQLRRSCQFAELINVHEKRRSHSCGSLRKISS
jgi:hypothetical protein